MDLDLSNINPKVLGMGIGGVVLVGLAMTVGGGKETMQENREMGRQIQEQRQANQFEANQAKVATADALQQQQISEERLQSSDPAFVFNQELTQTVPISEGHPVLVEEANGTIHPLPAGQLVADIYGCTGILQNGVAAPNSQYAGQTMPVATNVACNARSEVVMAAAGRFLESRGIALTDKELSAIAGGGGQQQQPPQFQQQSQPAQPEPTQWRQPSNPIEFDLPANQGQHGTINNQPVNPAPVESTPIEQSRFPANPSFPPPTGDRATPTGASQPGSNWAEQQSQPIPAEFQPGGNVEPQSTTDGNLAGN